MTSASNRAPGPDRRRRGGGAAHAAAMVGKVIGTIVLIMVITGAILACFAAVYIKTVMLLPRRREEGRQLKQELQGQLLEYQVCKLMAAQLALRRMMGQMDWQKMENIPGQPEEKDTD